MQVLVPDASLLALLTAAVYTGAAGYSVIPPKPGELDTQTAVVVLSASRLRTLTLHLGGTRGRPRRGSPLPYAMSFRDVRPEQQGRRGDRPPAAAAAATSSGTSAGYYAGRNGSSGARGGGEGYGAPNQGARGGGFGSAGPLRTGGVGVGRTAAGGAASQNSLHQGGFGHSSQQGRRAGAGGGADGSSGGSSGGGKVGDYLMIFSVSFECCSPRQSCLSPRAFWVTSTAAFEARTEEPR